MEIDRVVIPILSGIILLAVCICVLQVFNRHLGHDEFQHSHIAWLIGNGEILYRDFFDHHGPLYSILNGFAINAFSLDRDVSTIFALRALSLCFSLLTALVTYRVSLVLFRDRKSALCSVAFLVTAYFFVEKGSELRPDTFQNLGWMLGLYYLVRAEGEPSGRKQFFASGLFFGVAILANLKAAFGVAVAMLCFLLFMQFGKEGLTRMVLRLTIVMAGFLLPVILVLGYFLWHDALYEFYYSNTVFNFELMQDETSTKDYLGGITRNSTLSKFGEKNWGFALFAVMGMLQLLYSCTRHTDDEYRRKGLFLASLTAGTSTLVLLPFYAQIYLVFLPLWALLAGYSLIKLIEQIPKAPRAGVFIVLVLIAFLPVLIDLLNTVPLTKSGALRAQIDRSQHIVRGTAYEEPVAHVWNKCGGYVFNKSPDYFWFLGTTLGRRYESFKGYNPAGTHFVKTLEEGNVRFIVASKNRDFKALNPETRAYIEENYSYSNCLFTRN